MADAGIFNIVGWKRLEVNGLGITKSNIQFVMRRAMEAESSVPPRVCSEAHEAHKQDGHFWAADTTS